MNGINEDCKVGMVRFNAAKRVGPSANASPMRRVLAVLWAIIAMSVLPDTASAMEDVASGRWITRDPLSYNNHSILVSGSTPSLQARYAALKEQEFASDSSNSSIERATNLHLNIVFQRELLVFLANESKLAGRNDLATRLMWSYRNEMNKPAEHQNMTEYCLSSPIGKSDPLGTEPCNMSLVYGNWCGPHWSGGLCDLDCQQGPPAPPVDAVDACCEVHDNCYGPGGTYPIQACDIDLCYCILSVGQPPGMSYAYWYVMRTAFCTANGIPW